MTHVLSTEKHFAIGNGHTATVKYNNTGRAFRLILESGGQIWEEYSEITWSLDLVPELIEFLQSLDLEEVKDG